jgi:hypothetical protein
MTENQTTSVEYLRLPSDLQCESAIQLGPISANSTQSLQR